MEDLKVKTNEEIEKSTQIAKWYCLKTQPGKEKLVKDSLEKKMKNPLIAEHILEVRIIEEEKKEERKTKDSSKPFIKYKIINKYPNLIYIKFKYSKEMWWEVVSTEGAYAFLGPDARPQALRETEIYRLGLEEKPKLDIEQFNVGDKIKITDGPFAGCETIIEGIDQQNRKFKVSVTLLNMQQQIKIDIDSTQKIK